MKHAHAATMMTQRDVTVALTTIRESSLGNVQVLLKYLKKQTSKNFEVTVLVSGNKRYFEKLKNEIRLTNEEEQEIRVIFDPVDNGIAHSRNTLLENVRTPYIAYIDDDVVPDPCWLQELRKTLARNEKIAAATGPVIPAWETDAKDFARWFPMRLYWIIGCTPWNLRETTKVRNGFTSNLLVDRNIALEVGGFNENLGYTPHSRMTGEDPEFGIRLLRSGYVTLWNPNARVYHRIPRDRLKAKSIIARCFLEGKLKAHLRRIYGNEVLEVETRQLGATIKSFVLERNLKTKVFLLVTTLAVAAGYLSNLA